MFKILFFLFFSFVNAQDCFLQVPNDPLNTGLFQPWYLSTNPNSATPCSQTVPGTEVFVEATIFDAINNKLFVYNPLVIDNGTAPAVQPAITQLPANSTVVIHIGSNGDSVTLIPTFDANNISSLTSGNCVNGFYNSIFGQVAYCNAFNFFNQVNQNIQNGLLTIPPLQNSLLGDVCPTTRSFAVIDQDQSDNVITQYIITVDGLLAQDTNTNRNNLNVSRIISNGSDNRLLSHLIDPAIGCKPFMAPDLIDQCCAMRSSMALNEIQANLLSPLDPKTALIPLINPMTLFDGKICLEKTNLYRIGVNQPLLLEINNQSSINYCLEFANTAVPFFILHQNELANFTSPGDGANNLLNFLCDRFANSWAILNCEILTGNPSPITIQTINGTVVGNNLNTINTIPIGVITPINTTNPTLCPTPCRLR